MNFNLEISNDLSSEERVIIKSLVKVKNVLKQKGEVATIRGTALYRDNKMITQQEIQNILEEIEPSLFNAGNEDALKKIHKKKLTNQQLVKDFAEQKTKYKKLLITKQKAYAKSIVDTINTFHDSRTFWSINNKYK